jgi:hypothetical protein
MIRLVFALALSAVIATAAVADRRGGGDPTATATRREDIKKKIRTMRAYTLTEELGLDEATAGKLFPVLAKWDDVTDKLLAQRVNLTSQLRAAGQLAPKAIERLIDDAVANQRAFWDLEDKRLAELRKILSPAQTAQLLVVLPQFERKIQNQLRRAIAKGGRARGRARADFDDDDADEDAPPAELPGPQEPRTGPAKRVVPPATPGCDPFSSRYDCAPKR